MNFQHMFIYDDRYLKSHGHPCPKPRKCLRIVGSQGVGAWTRLFGGRLYKIPLSLTRQSTCLTASIGRFLSSFPAPLLSPADGRTTSSTPLLTPQVEQFPVVTFVQRPSGLPTHAAEVFGLGLGADRFMQSWEFRLSDFGERAATFTPPPPPPGRRGWKALNLPSATS